QTIPEAYHRRYRISALEVGVVKAFDMHRWCREPQCFLQHPERFGNISFTREQRGFTAYFITENFRILKAEIKQLFLVPSFWGSNTKALICNINRKRHNHFVCIATELIPETIQRDRKHFRISLFK